jgi:hypothetical protein
MDNKFKPIGWASSLSTLITEIPLMWKSVMTIENSPLKNFEPRAAHMIFQCLAFIWSGIFAAMISSYQAFGISALFHVLFISGVFITVMTFNTANGKQKYPTNYHGRGIGGEHE